MPKRPVKDVFGFWQLEGMEGADFFGKYEIPLLVELLRYLKKLFLSVFVKKKLKLGKKQFIFMNLMKNLYLALKLKQNLRRSLKLSENTKV